MFDVRPLRLDGSLNLEKIGHARRILKVERRETPKKNILYQKVSDVRRAGDLLHANLHHPTKKEAKEQITGGYQEAPAEIPRPNIIHLGKIVSDDLISVSKVPSRRIFSDRKKEKKALSEFANEDLALGEADIFESAEKILKPLEAKKRKRKKKRRDQDLNFWPSGIYPFAAPIQNRLSYFYTFIFAILVFSLAIPSFSYFQKSLETKDALFNSGKSALGEFAKARENLASGQFENASSSFEESYQILKSASDEVSKIGGEFSEILKFIPGISKIATASYLLDAGENIALAGKTITDSVKSIIKVENPLSEGGDVSLAELFLNLRNGVMEASQKLETANDDISKTNFSDLPSDIQPKFLELKEKLPAVASSLKNFTDNSNIMLDILGYNGPRKFLFLFQNNQEMRATGGFIGSYGILDISNGRIRKLFVDDIYNPDGQLTARVIPPEPIQKMSAVWTMHDANWFPNFPTSAEKVAWFFEKTGGPTVDGVIAMTPTVIEQMLSVTGPIEMPEYDATVDEKNFREVTQYEVEFDYDKKENRPKKFIADLMPEILDRLVNAKDPKTILKTLNILSSALEQKQILIYSKNYNLQKMVSDQGWSGEILGANKDYLSVINTNINGYKTDGIIKETIEHHANIEDDESITDEVTVTRKHNGGNEKYDWWNKVNGDYMRVYVPEGSKFLEASGQTREFVSPPLDYQSLQFKKDPQLLLEEQDTKIDDESGTRIYTENHKTVFANWVYVSPGETVVVKYKYKLPFRLSFDALHHPADTFSVLYQKQSGSTGSRLISDINLPGKYRLIWKYPDYVESSRNSFHFETNLETDKFVGFAVENND